MHKKITFKGKPVTLIGRDVEKGIEAPNFKVRSGELNEVTLEDFKDKVKVITSFLSLDTPVCDLQVKEFNRIASEISSQVEVLGISKDLPFAQKRFCEMNDIENVITFSDYKDSSFGLNYGLLIKELGLLARSIIILDKNNVVRYQQIVEEATNQPDYEDALDTLEEVMENPSIEPSEKTGRCVPCEAGTPPLDEDIIKQKLSTIEGWDLIEGKKLKKTFKQKSFKETKYLVDIISTIAEEQGHHPDMTIIYNKLKITLTTHAAGGLTDNDFIMAEIIDELARN